MRAEQALEDGVPHDAIGRMQLDDEPALEPRRDARLLTDEARSIPSPEQPSPSEVAMAGESAAELRRVIESLPEDYATVLRLVYLDGLTLVQAGERMGRSADAVRKTYGRALTRLAERVRGRRSTGS